MHSICFRTTVIAAALALCSLAALPSPGEAQPNAAAAAGGKIYTETPAAAERFVDSIGVDAKYEDNAYPQLVTDELVWSGIRHLRDSAPQRGTFLTQMEYLGRHGIHHSLGMSRNFLSWYLLQELAVDPQFIDYVEPANEADNFRVPNFVEMRTDQRRLWNTVRSNSAYNAIAVLGPSFANPGAHAALVGPLDSYEDFGVLHNATCDWNPAEEYFNSGIVANTAKIRPTTTYKQIWTTETGYSDNPERGCWLPDDVIAKYIPRTSTERFLQGEPRTYFVFLTDTSNVVFGHMGLLQADGTPKPQFLALANLIHVLSDPGAYPRTTSVTYGIVGPSSDVHHLLLARHDGSYDLLLYREVAAWDHHLHAPIAVSPLTFDLILPANMTHADLYRYSSRYSLLRSSLTVDRASRRTSTFQVDDAISIVHFGA